MKRGIKPKFKRMWEAHVMGTWAAEIVARNFASTNKVKKNAGMIEKNALIFQSQDTGTQFYNDVVEMNRAASFGYKKFTDDKAVKRYLEQSKKALAKGDRSYNEFIKANFQRKSVSDIYSILEGQVRIFNEIYTYFHACQPQYFSLIEKEIQNYLAENLPENKISEVYSTLTTPDKINALQQEECDWFEVVQYAKRILGNNKKIDLKLLDQHKNLKRKIENHSRKYIYLGTVEVSFPYDVKHYLKLLGKHIKENVSKKRRDIVKSKQMLRLKKKRIIKKHNIDKRIVNYCHNLAEVGHNRLALRFGWTKVSYMYIQTVSLLAQKEELLLLNLQTIWDYRPSELKEAVFKGSRVNRKTINKRKQSFLFHVKGGRIYFYESRQAIHKKNQLVVEEDYDVKEIKGNIASKSNWKSGFILVDRRAII